MKWVEIGGRYKFKVPGDFAFRQMSEIGSKWPTYIFFSERGLKHEFDVTLWPYSVNGDAVMTDCKVSREFDEGTFPAPIYCSNGTEFTVKITFTISEGRHVFAGWAVYDNSLECTHMSPCPHYVPPESRYSVFYSFFVPDKEHGTIVEFSAASVRTSSATVNEFKDIAKLLRQMVVPSLTPVH